MKGKTLKFCLHVYFCWIMCQKQDRWLQPLCFSDSCEMSWAPRVRLKGPEAQGKFSKICSFFGGPPELCQIFCPTLELDNSLQGSTWVKKLWKTLMSHQPWQFCKATSRQFRVFNVENAILTSVDLDVPSWPSHMVSDL
jgi:hypothetical protein